VLVRPRNPLNIGAAARAMSNFGFFDLRLVQPYDVAWKEARSAVGASAILDQAQVFPSAAAAIADCSLVVGTASLTHRDARQTVRRLESGARAILRHLPAGPAAILFGSEKHGLSNDDLSLCHFLMHIPTRDEHQSMNLGQAVAVILYELRRNPRAGSRQPRPRKTATATQLQRLEEILMTVLTDSGYLQPKTMASSAAKIRRLLRRMDLPEADAEVWLGMLRQVRWKIESAG